MSEKRRIAICGTAPSSIGEAPFDDEAWEIWGTSRLWKQIPRADAWFELHPLDEVGRGWDCTEKQRRERREEHIEWLAEAPIPVYLQDEDERIPGGLRYPLDEILEYVSERFGDEDAYFTNTISYMLAFALYSEVDEVGIWGVDMALEDEYQHQRPSVEYWIGLLRGAGIRVRVPHQCDLLQASHLYGYEWNEGRRFLRKLDARIEEMDSRKEFAQQQIEQLSKVHAAAFALRDNLEEILGNGYDLPEDARLDMAALIEEAEAKAEEAKGRAEHLRVERQQIIGAKNEVEYIKRSFGGEVAGGG